jgi:hypothetical protein
VPTLAASKGTKMALIFLSSLDRCRTAPALQRVRDAPKEEKSVVMMMTTSPAWHSISSLGLLTKSSHNSFFAVAAARRSTQNTTQCASSYWTTQERVEETDEFAKIRLSGLRFVEMLSIFHINLVTGLIRRRNGFLF